MKREIYIILRFLKKRSIGVLSFLNKFFPKRKIILFYNEEIRDNNKYVMEYMAQNTLISIICFYSLGKPDHKIPEGRVKYINNSIQLLFYLLTSTIIVTSFDQRFMIKPAKRQRIVQLWHGYALKQIGSDYLMKEKLRRAYYYTDILCNSEFWVENVCKAFGAVKHQLHIWDNPRNDLLYYPINHYKLEEILGRTFNKMILWMPTYRKSHKLKDSADSTCDLPVIHSGNIEQLDTCLKKSNDVLVIKLHALQNEIRDFAKDSTNIIIIDNKTIESQGYELYQFLASADALITDYSSVYFDFLKLKKPIGFVFDDYETYKELRGFAFDDVYNLMPGPKINDVKSFCDFVSNIEESEMIYRSERQKIRMLASKWDDNNNSARVSEFIMSIIGDEK